jgi:hypothetical protein
MSWLFSQALVAAFPKNKDDYCAHHTNEMGVSTQMPHQARQHPFRQPKPKNR